MAPSLPKVGSGLQPVEGPHASSCGDPPRVSLRGTRVAGDVTPGRRQVHRLCWERGGHPDRGSDTVNGARSCRVPASQGAARFRPLKTLSNHLNGNYGKDWSELGPF